MNDPASTAPDGVTAAPDTAWPATTAPATAALATTAPGKRRASIAGAGALVAAPAATVPLDRRASALATTPAPVTAGASDVATTPAPATAAPVIAALATAALAAAAPAIVPRLRGTSGWRQPSPSMLGWLEVDEVVTPASSTGTEGNISGDPIAPFDRDNFLQAMAAENLFDVPDDDDVNIGCDDVSDDASDGGSSELSGSEVGDSDPMEFAGPEFDDDSHNEYDDPQDDGSDEEGVDDILDLSFTGEEEATATQEYATAEELAIIADTWSVYDPVAARQVQLPAATDLYDGPWGPTKSAVAFALSPLGLFFYFLPKPLWALIAKEMNKYRAQKLQEIAEERHAKTVARHRENPAVRVKDVTMILEELKSRKPIEVHEVLHFIGLLIARVLVVHRAGLRGHWSVKMTVRCRRVLLGASWLVSASRKSAVFFISATTPPNEPSLMIV